MDRFLARPISVGSNNSGLLEHSLRTANRAREIAASIGVGEAAYYAGLLHDVGKLNPYIRFSSLVELPMRNTLRRIPFFFGFSGI
jgi:putative nucleotidyltransferase with HDIG domain